MAHIDKLLYSMVERGASDLHMTIGNRPMIRSKGVLEPLVDWLVEDAMLTGLLSETLPPAQWERALKSRDHDYAYEVPGLARFRVNLFFNFKGVAAVFRTIPTHIQTLDELGLPPVLKEMCKTAKGMVLVTGPTGSGKSTSLAAMIDLINDTREAHVLTIEDPIEFVHENKKCKITQREIFRDSHSFKAALRSSMRQDPDIILVGEMRDYETISLALNAAEMGILVLATLHTNSSAKTIDRIINVHPAEERDSARNLMASVTRGIISQQLLPTKDGLGRVAATEVLTYSPGLPNLIRTGKTSAITSLIETSGNMGMQTMDMCLMNLYNAGRITAEQAYLKSADKKKFLKEAEKEKAKAFDM